MAHEHLHHLAQAAADNDSMAEEGGIQMALGRLGLDVDDVSYVAEQRALRAVMVESGRLPELQRAHREGSSTRPHGFKLSGMERHKLGLYTAMYMDAIAIGWRAKELAEPTEQWVTFFPWGDFKPSEGYVSYGPFKTEEAAKEHARTLSSDPDEGEIARLKKP